jgi:CRP/FNR family transcriptional regulator, cyclic AMP receptor protein
LTAVEGRREWSGDVRQALLESGLFGKTDPAAVARWCAQLKPARVGPGRVHCARGDFGGRLYVIVSGKVEISHFRLGGREIALTVLGSYEIVGGVSLFDPAACETRVTALTEVLAVPIERGQLLMWMAECSEFSTQLLRLYARRVKEMTDTLTDFAFADVHSRVASRLLMLRRRFGHRDGEVVRIAHDLTLEDLSRLVGVSPKLIGDTLRFRGSRLDPCGREEGGGHRLPGPGVSALERYVGPASCSIDSFDAGQSLSKIVVVKWFWTDAFETAMVHDVSQ